MTNLSSSARSSMLTRWSSSWIASAPIFAMKRRFREKVVRILQGNLYQPETLARAREVIAMMKDSHQRISSDPDNILRPGALSGLYEEGQRGRSAASQADPGDEPVQLGAES